MARRPAPVNARTPFPHRNLPLRLLQARERVLAQFRPILNAHGVTEQQWRILRALAELGPLEPRQIVARCGISSPSLAGVLARMEELGLVQRERLAHDQRRQLVELTPASRQRVADAAPEIAATYAALRQRVGAARLDALHAALDELLALLGEGDDADGV